LVRQATSATIGIIVHKNVKPCYAMKDKNLDIERLVRDFRISNGLGIIAITLPFTLSGVTVCCGTTRGYICMTGISGFTIFGAIMYWARASILCSVKAGYIAVVIKLIGGKPMPQGRLQIHHATAGCPIPAAWAAGGAVFALLFVWGVKAALLAPFAIARLMQVYFKTVEGQQPTANGRRDWKFYLPNSAH
jgi:hypothetical protein